MEAYEAGLWIFWPGERQVYAVPRPVIRVEGEDLHADSGPAVAWPGGARYWFWRGVQVPQQVIEAPDSLTPAQIREERNVEVRRVMLERFGTERFLLDSEAELLDDDREFGKLWRVELEDDEPIVMVQVVNATAEPDGSFKDYFLRVPPRYRKARGAIAWTFDVDGRRYRPKVQT